jgi:hypothetical protein
MSIRTAFVVASAMVLVWPASAVAKEVHKAQVCGASKCFTFDRANSGDKLALFDGGGNPALPPARSAPWYRLRITVGGADIKRFTFTDAYVPSADRIRRRAEGGGYEWVEVIDDLKPVLRNVSARLEPLPASSLRGIHVAPAPAQVRATPAPPTPARDTGPAWYWFALAAGIGGGLLAVAGRRLHRRERPRWRLRADA